ncbi:MAG TPA: N-acetyl-gamma-glutamyl-phosphate reductase [Ktedonobacteraceae bacterium]|nr:N-acetyl-gamma-glutamyl-phosphate reductase [Ktedonobacteraceae bacterium]
MSRVQVAIVGGSGYTAGELLRILLFHPQVEVTQVASNGHAGQFVHSTHPNLRGVTALRYCRPDDLTTCDLLFLCLPHGRSAEEIEHYRGLASRVIDLSADFRLRSSELYRRWYGAEHPAPQVLRQAVYGLPELHREELREATLVSGTGCSATASILGLAPLYRAGLVNRQLPLVVESKMGSSAAGAAPGAGSHHPDRSGAVRSFQPTGHRHSAELIQELALSSQDGQSEQTVAFSATAVEMVRGILITAHVFLNEEIEEKRLWRVYREAYQREPFVRLVKERQGVYRYPEPKILAGSNYCDVGFELDARQGRVVVMAALDNLVKGAAGNGVQAMNCMYGWDETLGLSFPGLHPV